MSDIEIARKASLRPIPEIGAKLGISEESLIGPLGCKTGLGLHQRAQ